MSGYVDDVPPEDEYETAARVDGHVLIEQQVVGTAMRFPRAASELQREVTGEDFNDGRLGQVFDGVIAAALAGEPVDYLTVWQHLTAWNVRGIEVTDLSRWSDAAVSPTLGAAHAATVRRESMRRALVGIGETLRDTAEDPAVTAARVAEQLREVRDATPHSGKSVRWLREVLDISEDEDAYDWVIPNILERQDRLMLSAGEGVGKSTLLRQIAILAAAGIHPFERYQMDPVNVLVVDAENSERQWRRAARGLADLAATHGRRDPRDHLAVHCVPVMDITKPNDLGQIHRWIDETQPGMLLLGPLYRMTRGSLNKDEEVAPVLAALDSLRERNLAMLIEVHAGHARSSSGERELRPRGSSALLGWPEFGLGLRRNKEVEGRTPTFSLVRWRGDRDRREWPTRLVHGQVFPWERSF